MKLSEGLRLYTVSFVKGKPMTTVLARDAKDVVASFGEPVDEIKMIGIVYEIAPNALSVVKGAR